MPLTADALAAVSNTLVNARANGAVMIIRFGYTSGAETGAEPTDFDVLLGHIRQVGPILGAFPDVVLAVECGMTGPWGEMHSNSYREPRHIRAIGDAWLETLAKQTALLVRYPMWILEYAGKNVDEFLKEVEDGSYYKVQPAQRRIGMFNDGYLGTDADYGTWRHHEKWMVREQGVRYLEARRNVPYGGELAHISVAEAEAVPLFDLGKFNIVEEFYRTHLSYLRNISAKRHVLAERIGRLKLTHDYDFEGMPDLSEWYGTDLRGLQVRHPRSQVRPRCRRGDGGEHRLRASADEAARRTCRGRERAVRRHGSSQGAPWGAEGLFASSAEGRVRLVRRSFVLAARHSRRAGRPLRQRCDARGRRGTAR